MDTRSRQAGQAVLQYVAILELERSRIRRLVEAALVAAFLAFFVWLGLSFGWQISVISLIVIVVLFLALD